MKEATGPVLLSIDWDWVTGDCSDEHGHCGWCRNKKFSIKRGDPHDVIADWSHRMEKLMLLPFPAGRLWIAECHADILQVITPKLTAKIIHLDSHADDANWFGLCCGSWRCFLPYHTKCEVWKYEYINKITKFNDVFICQSSPWTPSSMDRFFWKLVEQVANKMGVEPEFIGHRCDALLQEWDGIQNNFEENRLEC